MADYQHKAPENLSRLQYAFAAHLRDPDNKPAPTDIEDRRMQIYRDLFFNNIVSFLGGMFPVTCGLMGEERWRLLMRDYFRDHKSETPLFPEMPTEFLNWLAEERADGAHSDSQDDPDFLYELAHFEWVKSHLRLGADPVPDSDLEDDGDLLDDTPVIAETAWAVSYRYPVDAITVADPPGEPEAQPLHYVVYRSRQGGAMASRLNAVSARLYQLLHDNPAGLSGESILRGIAAELGHPEPDQVLTAGLQILSTWRDLGILAGSRTSASSL